MAASAEKRHAAVAAALRELAEGATLREIEAKHGIARSTLYRWLMSDVPVEYRELQQMGLIARIDEADTDLETADSHVKVNRAAQVCKYRRWDAERRAPHLFSQRHELTGPGGTPLVPVLSDFEIARRFAFAQQLMERRTIDVTPATSEAST